MLAHSPPLPLVLDYIHISREVSVEDEEGTPLALQHRDRVRRVRLEMPVERLQKLVMSIDDEFQTLEYLYIMPPAKHDTGLILPETLRAPHLRHLMLRNFAFPIRSPLLTGLVTLSLKCIHPSAYFSPNDLLRRFYHSCPSWRL
ncbi:hypothetical protein BC827DRAFT_1268851 [Russula dissimulans]|nr:hypothetical protein BC827DRAFT_1268851 [Russula dissimulans]